MYEQFVKCASILVIQNNPFSKDSPETIILQSTPDQTTKDFVISLLAEIPGANCKQIHQITKKIGSKAITFQGIHKTLHQLNEQKVILKTNHKYYLNTSWVKQTKDYYQKLEEKLEKSKEDNIVIVR